MNNKLQTLEKLLQNHDWFYQYSDDFSVYERGDRESDAINEVINALKMQVLAKKLMICMINTCQNH